MTTTSSTAFFAACFLAGVACGVYVMIRGVERPSAARSLPNVDAFGRELGSGAISTRAAAVAAALASMGLVGYLVVRVFSTAAWVAAVAGLAAAAVAVPLAVRSVRRWAARAVADDPVDPRFALQGHVARVVQAGAPEHPAAVEYFANGRRIVAPAECVDHSPLMVGSDVVIDRVEDGVVFVEPWARVEQRL